MAALLTKSMYPLPCMCCLGAHEKISDFLAPDYLKWLFTLRIMCTWHEDCHLWHIFMVRGWRTTFSCPWMLIHHSHCSSLCFLEMCNHPNVCGNVPDLHLTVCGWLCSIDSCKLECSLGAAMSAWWQWYCMICFEPSLFISGAAINLQRCVFSQC